MILTDGGDAEREGACGAGPLVAVILTALPLTPATTPPLTTVAARLTLTPLDLKCDPPLLVSLLLRAQDGVTTLLLLPKTPIEVSLTLQLEAVTLLLIIERVRLGITLLGPNTSMTSHSSVTLDLLPQFTLEVLLLSLLLGLLHPMSFLLESVSISISSLLLVLHNFLLKL